MSLRRLLLPLALALPASLPAQALLDASARGGPRYVSYRIGGAVGERISELAIPIVLVTPLFGRVNVDIATAYVSSRVEFDEAGAPPSTINGLTDTQLRASYTFGNDAVVLTAGVNLPTGHATVREEEIAAAGRIGNDFLAFPISNMGTGFAGTAGIAVARPLGAWNVGAGASLRYAAPYEAFDVGGVRPRYQPGNEYRLRVGADRPVGAGRLALGATFSAFGDDATGGYTYPTGDRYVLQAGYSVPVGGVDLSVSAWDLIRGHGRNAIGATTPWENLFNVAVGAGFNAGTVRLEPNVEFRTWAEDSPDPDRTFGVNLARLGTLGLRARRDIGRLMIAPSAGYTVGRFTQADASLTGWNASLTLRLGS